jgi:TonB family protein
MRSLSVIFILFFIGCNNSQKIDADKKSQYNNKSTRVEWTRPQIIKKSKLIYPDSLKKLNISGTVWVECLIDTVGNVVKKRVIESSDSRLNQVALQTISGYTFSS